MQESMVRTNLSRNPDASAAALANSELLLMF
jgi:hypothetical protein